MSTESVMPSKYLKLCHPLLLLPLIFPSFRVFSNESVFWIRQPNYWSFSFSISPFNEYSGLIFFQVDRLDLLEVQASVLSFQKYVYVKKLSHSYLTTGKTIALTTWIFFSKVMPLLFNMLSRLVIAFLQRSKCLLISWLQSPSAVILEPPQMKSVTVFIVPPSICHEVMGMGAMIFAF